jgi:hypothetical protein
VARAASPAATSGDGFSVGRLFKGLDRRERVIQFSVGAMCLALLILCKRFDGDPK